MKKSIIASLLVAGGVAAYCVLKALEENTEPEEVAFVKIEDPDEEEEEDPDGGKIKPAIEEISMLYPYLKPTFVNKVYQSNEELNEAYPEDTLVVVSHKVAFKEEAQKEAFKEIAEENGYEVNDGDSLVVSKRFFTEDGRIISDIYTVANQVACLNGEYMGYNIEK